eukprot:gene21258-28178_t
MGKPAEMTSALGILAAMTEGSNPQRQVMIDAKPNPMPHLLASLEQDSAPLRTAACALMYVVISKEDTRPRLWRLMKEWDWTPLFNCLNLLELSSLGGRNAALDTMRIIDTMVNLTGSPVNNNMSNASCSALVQYKGLEPIVSLLKNRIAHPMAKASGLSILNQILRRSPGALAESVIVGQEAMSPIVNLFHHYVVPLLHKAYGACEFMPCGKTLLRLVLGVEERKRRLELRVTQLLLAQPLLSEITAAGAEGDSAPAGPTIAGAEGDSAPAGPTIAAESPEPVAAGAATTSPAATSTHKSALHHSSFHQHPTVFSAESPEPVAAGAATTSPAATSTHKSALHHSSFHQHPTVFSAESPEPVAAGAATTSPAATSTHKSTGAPPAPAPRTSTSGAARKADLRQAITDNLEGFAGGAAGKADLRQAIENNLESIAGAAGKADFRQAMVEFVGGDSGPT